MGYGIRPHRSWNSIRCRCSRSAGTPSHHVLSLAGR
jgi:hypothetical protein